MTDLAVLGSLADVVDVVRTHELVYLRYSAGAEEDLSHRSSRDYEADVDLPGLSVTVASPEPWWPRPVDDWVARRLCKCAELGAANGRFPWLLTGRIVWNGPDHEPLVDQVRPLARVSDAAVREAVCVYHERFQTGEDSRAG
ncbi:MAG TPA: DUF6098 family protein [Actinomycetes bacterium]|nr:DUF6098 family protein [Actinomycetes bacterium]